MVLSRASSVLDLSSIQPRATSQVMVMMDDGVGDVGDVVDNEIGHEIGDDNEDGVLNPIRAWV